MAQASCAESRLSGSQLPQLFCLLLLCASAANARGSSRSQLLQVTLLFRHGDRTPMRPLPLDPHRSALAPLGWAQLVEQGVRQHYRLGQLLRRRYGDWLARRFNVTTMHIRSTATDRTLMSALAHVAGLFPDQCNQVFKQGNDYLPACYPVPVHSEPVDTDNLLKTGAHCPKYSRHWLQFRSQPHGPYARSLAEFAWLAEIASDKTGWSLSDDLSGLWKVADSVTVWQRMGLALPAWVNQTVMDGLLELKRRKFVWRFEDIGLQSASASMLVATLLKDQANRLAGISNKQLQLYSAHDGAVSAFLHAFQVFNGLQPPTAACVIVELYSDGEVRLLYKNTTELGEPHLLEVPFCPAPCLRHRLEAAMRRRGVWADTARAMCGDGSADNQPKLGPLHWPYLSLLFMITTACVSFVLLL